MSSKEDSAWVFDSLVGFLQGPIWSAPLLTFIEEKSLIFEAETEDSDDYRKMYREYKNLVDLLLGCFMEDIGITPEQFEHACALNKHTKLPVQFQQNLFEQIWAANEYEIFKRMMIQKNLELQLQALNAIEKKYGLTPASLMYETDTIQDDELVMEDLINKGILNEQVEEEEEGPSTESSFLEEHRRLATEYRNEKALLEEVLKVSLEQSQNVSPRQENSSEADEESVKTPKGIQKIKEPLPIKSIPAQETVPEQDKVQEEDIKRRRDYLKARRDKLVALKKEARSQRLETNKTRPSSARAVAEATLRGKQELEEPQILNPSILQVRKALAARLKAEVVHK